MDTHSRIRGLTAGARMVAGWLAAAVFSSALAAAPTWKPDKAVELIAPSAAGGGTDLTARTIQKVLQEKRLIDVATSVVNKPGGGGNIALAYLSQHSADGHYLEIASALLLTNHIAGKSPLGYLDFTPLALLTSEYLAFAVKADSPLKTGKDLAAQLRKDPGSISIAVGTSLGGVNHAAAALIAKAAGADVKKLKTVVFKSSAESATALLGGHIDLVVSSASLVVPHAKAGQVRLLAISAPHRGQGVLAAVPTWKEQGYDIVVDNFRTLIGPSALNAAQVAYWEAVFAKLVQTEDWRKDLENNLWENNYMGSRDSRDYLDSQYGELRRVLSDLGMAK
jgi:putative tricarboxylic transport membrane protein